MGLDAIKVSPISLSQEIYPTTEIGTYNALVERIDDSRKNDTPLNPSDLVGYAFLIVGQRHTDRAPRLVLQQQLKDYREIAHNSWTRVYGKEQFGEEDKKIVSLILGDTLSLVTKNEERARSRESYPLSIDEDSEDVYFLQQEKNRLEYAIKQLGFEPDLLVDCLSNMYNLKRNQSYRKGGVGFGYLLPDDIDLSTIGDRKEAINLQSDEGGAGVNITTERPSPKPVEEEFGANNRWGTVHNTVKAVVEKLKDNPGSFSSLEEEVKTIARELIRKMSSDSLNTSKDVKGKKGKELFLRQALNEIVEGGILEKREGVDRRKLANLELAWTKWGNTGEVKSSEQLQLCQRQFTEIIDSLN